MYDSRLKNLGRLALFSAALLWGVSFVAMKNILTNIPTLYILAIRFCGAAIILLPACVTKLKKTGREHLPAAALLGVTLLLAYIFQTYGLRLTTPGKNAFLTSAYCVIVPFLYWAASAFSPSKGHLRRCKRSNEVHPPYELKRGSIAGRPDIFNVVAAFICIAGIGFISLDGSFNIGAGDTLTIVCGLFFAIHIVITSKAVEKRDPIMLSMLQFAAAGVLSLLCAFIFEPFPTGVTTVDVWTLVFLTVVSTALCIAMQVFGQKHTPPSQAAVIMTFESVFGAISSVIFYREVITLRLFAGFSLTFAAVIISETKLTFLKRKIS